MIVKHLTQIKKPELDQIMHLWLTSNLEAHDFIDPSYWSNAVDAVRSQIATADIYVAKENEAIIAFAGLVGNYVAGIFVAHQYRNQGIGGAIITALKQDYSALELNVFTKNSAAVKFYQKHDFSIAVKSIDTATGEQELQMKWHR